MPRLNECKPIALCYHNSENEPSKGNGGGGTYVAKTFYCITSQNLTATEDVYLGEAKINFVG